MRQAMSGAAARAPPVCRFQPALDMIRAHAVWVFDMMEGKRQGVRRGVERLAWSAALVALCLTAVQPFLFGQWPWRGDGLLHYYRLTALERAVAHGVWFPRWLPELGFGYGFPLFNYYAPLSYYLMLPARWVGFSAETTLRLSFSLALLLAGLGLFGWLQTLHAGRQAGLIAALSAVYAPYLLYNVHHRGALAEAWGLAWLSLSAWALTASARRAGRGRLLAAVIAPAALMLSHNISALLGWPLLALLGVAVALAQPPSLRWRALARVWGPLALALALTAFFWLPALTEQGLVQIHQLYAPSDLDFRQHFTSLAALLHPPVSADPLLVNPPIPLSYSWPVLLLAALAWWPGALALRGARLGLTLTVLGLTALMLPFSRPLWESIDWLKFVQFPWRLLGPASLALAALAGLGAARLTARWAMPSGALLVVGFALFWLFPARRATQLDPSILGSLHFEATTGALGTTSAGDYLPVAVQTLPPAASLWPAYAAAPDGLIDRLDRTALPPEARAEATGAGWLNGVWQVASPAGFTARFLAYYFPGWQVAVDGAPATTGPVGEWGLIAAEIPPGPHTISLTFASTPARRAAAWLSWAALGTLFVLFSRSPRLAAAAITPPALTMVWPLVLVGLALFGLKTFWLEQADTIFRRSALPALATGSPVDFGERLRLLDFTIARTTVSADERLAVTLYWQAPAPVTADYSVALHLVDDQGRRFAQSDHQHPTGYPVSRWQPQEYARDVHFLSLEPGAPPGRYRLLLLVTAADGARLTALDDAGRPVAAYPLADIEVTPPRVWPAPTTVAPQRLLAAEWRGLRLLGVDAPDDATLSVGQWVPTTFYWYAAAPPATDLVVEWGLLAADGSAEWLASASFAPGRADWPTSSWPPGALVADPQALWLAPARPDGAPLMAGAYQLAARWRDVRTGARGPLVPLAALNVTTPERAWALPAGVTPFDGPLGPVALAGLALTSDYRPNAPLQLTLVWQSRQVISTSYTVFVHLLSADDQIVAQSDQLPAGGARPTTGWLPPEYVSDAHTLTLPAQPGRYHLAVGLYDAVSGARLGERLVLPAVIEVPGE